MLALVDAVLASIIGLRITDLLSALLPLAILAPSVAFYAYQRAALPFDLTHCLARYYALGFAALVLSYIAATTPAPLVDPMLARADAALGFDWRGWYRFVNSHPWFQTGLQFAYASMQPQIVLCLIGLAVTGMRQRSEEMFWVVAISVVLSLSVAAIFPAESAWVYHGYAEGKPPPYLAQILGLRAGTLRILAPADLGGIVTFPSYHAATAVFLIWLSRRTWLFIPSLLLNAAMLVSTVSEGGHYLIDVPAGIATVAISIAIITRWRLLTRPAG